ncbi:hypothetical protein [Chitinivibrio alkaliphilus]|uniref:Chemotaxis methyl-accepting receptor HlyB-like 4HB MCP domain-containing protein n=1 Tax=Chitinivibrio alkaliphilus ACht1 TaxID=1313304 RepID=U7D864_9BACT|nr:hypothetical protein [Chitinivibrio alkaliphilus]ERP31272.1 hypothetical protein CALK_1760 [Chitinivibrio alkaliphilus ACht1]
MKSESPILIGMYGLIFLTLSITAIAIWGFVRMAPAVENILRENHRSVNACYTMLSTLASLNMETANHDSLKKEFENALRTVQNNITEEEEIQHIKRIESLYLQFFVFEEEEQFNREYYLAYSPLGQLMEEITRLKTINDHAMEKANQTAQHRGYASAWLMVFLGLLTCWASLVFKGEITKNLTTPLEDIHDVLTDIQRGNTIRRCSTTEVSPHIRNILTRVNTFLDTYV